MKSVALFIIGVFVGFILLSNQNIIDFSRGKKYFSRSQRETNRYGDYDPGKDRKFTQEERDYFNKIAKVHASSIKLVRTSSSKASIGGE